MHYGLINRVLICTLVIVDCKLKNVSASEINVFLLASCGALLPSECVLCWLSLDVLSH